MKIFRTTMAAVFILLATVPMHGMGRGIWDSIKYGGIPGQGLTVQTQSMIGGALAIGVADKLFSNTSLINWAHVIAQSSNPLLLRTVLLANGAIIPVCFFLSLRNNPDFWNRNNLADRLFLATSTLVSAGALMGAYYGLTR